jgi:hypothetical protein
MKTALMALMLGAAACALGDGWGDAMRQAQGLQILHRLGLNRTQLQAAAPLADKLRESRAKTEHLRTEAVTGFKDGLSLQREALLSGPAAEDAVETAAEVHRILRGQEATAQAEETSQLAAFRGLLTPRQAAQVDWGDLSSQPTTSADLQRRALQDQLLLRWAEQTLQQIRYFPIEMYIVQKEPLITDFVGTFLRPGTPEYAQARAQMEAIVEQARLTPENQWLARRPYYAVALLGSLHLDAAPATAVAPRYTRAQLLAFLAAPDTPQVLASMAAASPASAPGTPPQAGQ